MDIQKWEGWAENTIMPGKTHAITTKEPHAMPHIQNIERKIHMQINTFKES